MPMGKQRSVDSSRFAMVPRVDVPRSAFDIQFTHKTTFEAGLLIPIYLEEILPGDSVKVRMSTFARLATPLVPIMDNLWFESFFFFVPNRLVWDNWERFMGEQANPTDSTVFLVPTALINAAACLVGTMADYFGVTVNGSANVITVNALPFRAYNRIWNEWFRDEDLQTQLVYATDDGPDGAPGAIQNRGKKHDYFTSARPWPQKPVNLTQSQMADGPNRRGGPMTFPQAGAPVSGFGVQVGADAGGFTLSESGTRQVFHAQTIDTALESYVARSAGGFPDVRVLINDIRTANAVQVFMERSARGGTRYTEIVRSMFGVTSPDARLQRTEYLGGGRSPVVVNPIAQTSETTVNGNLGELAGVGTVIANHGFSGSFTEHGFIIGLVTVRADLTYQQGVSRMWWRRTQFDYYWPAFANLGEQAIPFREIYCDGDVGDIQVFGYQERWSEYKYHPSMISGAFRSTAILPLDIWHLAQDFVARPALNAAFIIEDPPIARVAQVSTYYGEHFLCDTFFECRMVRAMPMHSIPGLGPRL